MFSLLSVFFSDVQAVKPRSSRVSSLEAFVVCRGFRSAAAPVRMIDAGAGYPYNSARAPLEGQASTSFGGRLFSDLCEGFVDCSVCGVRRSVRL